MRPVGQGIEEEIRQRVARQVILVGGERCEDEAHGVDARRRRAVPEAQVHLLAALQQPEHAARHAAQDRHPAGEDEGRDLLRPVEAAEDGRVLRQPGFRAGRRRSVGARRTLAVIGLVAGQAQDAFRIEPLLVRRDDDGVGDDVVVEGRAHAARIAEPVDDDRGRPPRQQRRACAAGVAVHVDQDVDAVLQHQGQRPVVVERRDVAPVLDTSADAGLDRVLLRDAAVVGEDLHRGAVVLPQHLRHQVADGVPAEVGGEVADAQPTPRHRGDAGGEVGGGAEGRRRRHLGPAVGGGAGELQQRIVGVVRQAERRHPRDQRCAVQPRQRLQQRPAALALAQRDPVLHHVALGAAGQFRHLAQRVLRLRQVPPAFQHGGHLLQRGCLPGEAVASEHAKLPRDVRPVAERRIGRAHAFQHGAEIDIGRQEARFAADGGAEGLRRGAQIAETGEQHALVEQHRVQRRVVGFGGRPGRIERGGLRGAAGAGQRLRLADEVGDAHPVHGPCFLAHARRRPGPRPWWFRRRGR